MADKRFKSEHNVEGKYYVDNSCISAKLCVAAAPANFRLSDAARAYVYKQPETPQEEEQAVVAVKGCPVRAIGDDGEQD